MTRKTNTSSNASAFAELCLRLNRKPVTQAELVEATGLQPGTVSRWLRILRRRHLIYVYGWYRKGTVGHWAAMWAWGYMVEDALKPKAQSQAQYSRNYRIKKTVRENTAHRDTCHHEFWSRS